MDIFIRIDGQQMGPYTMGPINEYLAQGSLLTSDYAWHEGLDQWVPLNEIAGVTSNQTDASAERPQPTTATTRRPTRTILTGKDSNKRKRLSFGGIGVGIAVFMAVFLVLILTLAPIGCIKEQQQTKIVFKTRGGTVDWYYNLDKIKVFEHHRGDNEYFTLWGEQEYNGGLVNDPAQVQIIKDYLKNN